MSIVEVSKVRITSVLAFVAAVITKVSIIVPSNGS